VRRGFDPPDQPTPFEPDAEVLEAINAFADLAIRRQTWHTEETFEECRVCGEWDSHTDDCPMPAIVKWIHS